MKKILLCLVSLVILQACQADNVSFQSAILAGSVSVTDQYVETNGITKNIVATDCKKFIEDGAPTSSIALEKLKSIAAQSGFNSIHSVVIISTGASALLANCWSQIKATGVAYNR